MAPYSKAPVVKISSSHPEFPTYHPLETPMAPIPSTSHYLTETPMLLEDLGMGMALTLTPCALISVVPVMMTGLKVIHRKKELNPVLLPLEMALGPSVSGGLCEVGPLRLRRWLHCPLNTVANDPSKGSKSLLFLPHSAQLVDNHNSLPPPPPLILSNRQAIGIKQQPMKKLYRKGAVHPSPPLISDHLAFLPAAILTLTAALTPGDREVLAYLLSCSGGTPPNANNSKNSISTTNSSSAGGGKKTEKCGDHPPSFSCSCFRCYMSYWVRWDSSPNRQLIHEIIDAFEDELAQNKGKTGKNGRRERKKSKGFNGSALDSQMKQRGSSQLDFGKDELTQPESVAETSGDGGGGDEGGCLEGEKGSVRKFMSFIGERIWSVWGSD
ncbi:hypothetical protein Ancab_004812 [Ancistrocladus abbreviatus]